MNGPWSPASANPYETSPGPTSSEGVDDAPRWSRAIRLAWVIAYFYPLHLLIAMYGSWLGAWMTLGHMPRPMLDDPKSIGGLMPFVIHGPEVLLVALPVATPLGLAASFFLLGRRRGVWSIVSRFLLAVLYITMCVVAIMILRSDPGRVVEWFFD